MNTRFIEQKINHLNKKISENVENIIFELHEDSYIDEQKIVGITLEFEQNPSQKTNYQLCYFMNWFKKYCKRKNICVDFNIEYDD